MAPETGLARLGRWLMTLVTSFVAFCLMLIGAVIGRGLPQKLLGAGIGGFLGGLLVGQLVTPGRSRLAVAAGWAAFAVFGGASGYGVFLVAPDPGAILVFPIAGLVGGVVGGLGAILIQGPVLWTIPRMRAQWSTIEVFALTVSGIVFLIGMRLELPLVALPLAALCYAGSKEFQPHIRA